MVICCNRGQFFLIFLFLRAKLLTPDWSSGQNTCSSLVEHASSTFRWFLHFVSKNNKFSSSLEFNCLSRVICTTNTVHGNLVLQLERKFLNIKFSCLLQETAKDYLHYVKAKKLDQTDICLAEEIKSVTATKYFHLATSQNQ